MKWVKNNASWEIIWNNMINISEYENILKTNVKQLLDTSSDRSRILNALIGQLEFRYENAVLNIKKLNNQKQIFLTNMEKKNNEIEELKIKLEVDYKKDDSKASLENIDKYLELKKEFLYSKTYIIYIDHFLYEYWYFNNYNKILLDTLINNKVALIQNSFVVIPDSGDMLLKNFNLLYTEEEYKK